MKIKASDIKQAIQVGDDFGHEMRVGNIFNLVPVSCSHNSTYIEPPEHGGTYTDSITNKPRQFDYRCHIFQTNHSDFEKRVLLAVECKNLHESSPLVLSGRPRVEDEAYHAFIESKYDELGKLSSVAKRSGSGWRLYHTDKFVGKSLVRMKESKGKLDTDTQSDVYDRWSQALSSSVELAESAVWCAKNRGRPFRILSAVLPIVVVPNETLWQVDYDKTGSIQKDPAMIDECEYFVDRKIRVGVQFVLTHVHFVTMRGFTTLLTRFVSDSRIWERIFPNDSTQFEF